MTRSRNFPGLSRMMQDPFNFGRDDCRSLDELIAAALAEPDEESAWDAIWTLRWRGSREVFERASLLCGSPCAVERRLAAQILGQLGLPDRSLPKPCLINLIVMLEAEHNPTVLSSVLVALGHLREPRAIRPSARFRDHDDSEVRYGVVHALTGYDDPLAVATLIELTRDSVAEIRDWACFGLGTQIEVDTPDLRDALAGRLSDDNDDVRCEAMVGLARRGDRRILAGLRRALTSERVFALEVESASLVADPQLHPELVALRGWWDIDEELLERAILACSP